MSENGLAIMRNPCLRCVDKDMCGICELNILRQKEQPPKRVEYKKTEEIQMRNENEMKNAACEDPGLAEARRSCCATKKLYNPYETTVHLMLSSDYRQTKIRYGKLKAYCDRIEMAETHPKKVEMPPHDCNIDLMRTQLYHMRNYLDILEERAIVEGISLD